MLALDESICRFYRAGKITRPTAEQNATDASALNR